MNSYVKEKREGEEEYSKMSWGVNYNYMQLLSYYNKYKELLKVVLYCELLLKG